MTNSNWIQWNKLRSEGLSYSEIASRFNVTKQAVAQQLKRGEPLPPTPVKEIKPLDQVEKDLINGILPNSFIRSTL